MSLFFVHYVLARASEVFVCAIYCVIIDILMI